MLTTQTINLSLVKIHGIHYVTQTDGWYDSFRKSLYTEIEACDWYPYLTVDKPIFWEHVMIFLDVLPAFHSDTKYFTIFEYTVYYCERVECLYN